MILLTPELGSRVRDWQRKLGLPEAGISEQPEAGGVAKTLTWGTNEVSARAIVLLSDLIGGAAIADNSLANSVVIHELGHVADYFERHRITGFPQPAQWPMNTDWPGIRAFIADVAWSEYAAESVAVLHMSAKDMRDFQANDLAYLEGVNTRSRQLVEAHKAKQISLLSLWNTSITNICNLFANFGRAAAHLPSETDLVSGSMNLAPSGEMACWRPIIEKLCSELNGLRALDYADWPTSHFAGIEEIVESGFQAVGLFPICNGKNFAVAVK